MVAGADWESQQLIGDGDGGLVLQPGPLGLPMVPDQVSCRKGLWVVGIALSRWDGIAHGGHGVMLIAGTGCIQVILQQVEGHR